MATYKVKHGSVKTTDGFIGVGGIIELDPVEAKKLDPEGYCLEAGGAKSEAAPVVEKVKK